MTGPAPSPAELGFSMPAEWQPHERTWMAFPTPNDTFGSDPSEGGGLDTARRAWASVADTIVRHEPVSLIVNPGETETARRYVSPAVEVVERPLDDAWMRDIGPTFLTDGRGGLAAADWVFNGWGAQSWASWDNDEHVAEHVAELSGARRFASRLVNEGGGIHVDGEGTVLITETVQLDPGRNPGWTREEVERELHAFLGTRKAIWLPRGLTRDYDEFGTRGHVDIVAAFLRPGLVVAHSQPDPAHPDHEVCKEITALLRASTDAHGRPLEVVELAAPTVLHDEDGEPVDYSYINHYLANGSVVLCAFDDPRDEAAAEVFAKVFPERAVELVDARPVFANGGGIHCITQQQPKA
ncbi:agmatine deiminase family protein [Streptacidiphilus sp. ASG 303]|uniref:agmatine deiminase family protein n=1 Tax=Streptacidiphilus sp. ASG 303 TaxID=2896847 RepID=UPI001E2FDD10|nr:agmatine deiminase family protein [Streptacidiphilus sp. ASG 303]MCD0481500.1 agmatine deiminase family protein [Streptacidiphilus sp. ASG 303]